jgi:hypothetical protein
MERRKPQHRAIVLDTAAVSFKTYMFDGHPATDAQQCQLGTVMVLPAMTVTITGLGFGKTHHSVQQAWYSELLPYS